MLTSVAHNNIKSEKRATATLISDFRETNKRRQNCSYRSDDTDGVIVPNLLGELA